METELEQRVEDLELAVIDLKNICENLHLINISQHETLKLLVQRIRLHEEIQRYQLLL